MLQPLDKKLNIAVQHIASKLFPKGFDVSENAPNTLEGLCHHINSTGRMLVWSGASDHTIFADKETNYCFRAWHDFHHWKHKFAFDEFGEFKTLRKQIWDIWHLFGHFNEQVQRWEKILDAEIMGQLRYEQEQGHFPENQHGFVEQYLTDKGLALSKKWEIAV